MKPSATLDASRPVWDLFVRVFHWTLVVCVLMNSFVLDDGETIHQWAGYLASALVLARVVWGFVGSRHARFADFFPTPGRIARHVRGMLSGHAEFHWGHNPLGALMMLALWAGTALEERLMRVEGLHTSLRVAMAQASFCQSVWTSG